MTGPVDIRLTVNGQTREGRCEPRKLLVDFIREDLGLTGTHIGCEHGVCGACTIFYNGEAVRSCIMFAVQANDAELVTVEGLARLTPGTTYIFVSNHQSHYDTPVVFTSLPYQLRIIAKESLARFPVLGWHLKRGGHLFVDRKHPDRSGILKRWRALVSEGLSLIIYAEGTRSADGHVARFKAGSFLLAIQAGLPIVPVAIIGTRQVMPKGRLRTEPADVTIIVHDPIQPPAIEAPTAHDAKALADRAHAIVSAAVEQRQFVSV